MDKVLFGVAATRRIHKSSWLCREIRKCRALGSGLLKN